MTNIGPGAARADIIVVCQVDIENKLSLNRLEIFRIHCVVILGLTKEIYPCAIYHT